MSHFNSTLRLKVRRKTTLQNIKENLLPNAKKAENETRISQLEKEIETLEQRISTNASSGKVCRRKEK